MSKSIENKYQINELIKEVTEERNKYCNLLALTNFFIVKLPEEMGIDYTDIISFEFTDEKKCRIVIRDNFIRFPLFTINEYIDKHSKWSFLTKEGDDMIVEYLDKCGMVQYTSTLKDIVVERVRESKLNYVEDGFHTITIDFSFKKRILNQYGATNKE